MTDLTKDYAASLLDSDTNEAVTAEDLGITEEQYGQLVDESINCAQAEGHVRATNGRKVYAY